MKFARSLAFKTLALAVALSFAPATASLPLSPIVGVSAAKADPGWDKRRHSRGDRGHYRGGRSYYRDRGHYRGGSYRRHRGDAGAAAVIGGIVGLGIGAAIASQPRYVEPAPRYYRAAPVYAGSPRPWTGEWYRYCAARYRSFDAKSGTFQPYHGPRQLCR